MKKFVGISSILLLSSILGNTSVSLASAAETKEAKVVDTTKSIDEKKSSSDDTSDSSTNEKNTRDIASTSTEESSAVEEVNGTAMLQDPAKDLLDKITESTSKEDSEEKASKEDKEKGDKKSEEAKGEEEVSSLMKDSIQPRFDFGWRNDFTWDTAYIDGQKTNIITGIKPSSQYKTSLQIVGFDSTGSYRYPVAVVDDVFKNNPTIQVLSFDTQIFNGKSYQAKLVHRVNGSYQSTTNATGIFSNMSKLTRINLAGLDTSHVTNFNQMFKNDVKLTIAGLSGMDTSRGITFRNMFENCQALKEADISTWDLHSAKDMTQMFMSCRNMYQVFIDTLPNGINMSEMFLNAPIIYAQLNFANPRSLAGDLKNTFLLRDTNYLPLLIYSNSQTFLNNKTTPSENKYYTYADFAGDGRTIPFMLASGDGLFKQTVRPPYFTQFDVNGTPNHNEKLCMVRGITNGYATDEDPTPTLLNAKSTVQRVLRQVNPYPTVLDDKMPPKEDKSRFYANYYIDETMDRMKGWHKVFDSAPEHLKAIFTKITAQYAPVNPEMEKGHVVDSKNPNSKTWPDNRMPQAPLGFAYQPDTLTAEIELGDIGQPLSGKLDVPDRKKSAQDDGLFHIGVRDYTRRDNNNGVGPKWTVNAQYRVTNPTFKGSYINFDKNTLNFNLNNFKNITNQPVPFKVSQLATSYDPDGDPGTHNNINLHGVSSAPSTKQLTDGRTVQLMSSDGTQVQQFYDLNLGNLTLNLPKDNGFQPTKEAQNVGQINWNLTTAPNGK